MIRSTLLLSLLFLSSTGSAQTYLGKRFTFSVGTQLIPTFKSQDFLEMEKTYFPLKLELDARLALSRKITLGLNGDFHGLPNFSYYVHNKLEKGKEEFRYNDIFQVSTNTKTIGLDIMVFREYGPIGKHFTYSLGLTSSTSTVYPILHETIFNDYNNVKNTNQPEAWEARSNYLKIGAGYGITRIVTNHLQFEYGIRTAFFVGLNKSSSALYPFLEPTNPQDFDYQQHTAYLTRQMVRSHLRKSNILQLYVKFGIIY